MNKRNSESKEFTSWDNTRLFYRTWAPDQPGDRAVILIHRGHEHSARLQALLDDLNLPDFRAFSWDNRGHGHSPGKRGDAPNYAALVRDLDCFVQHIIQHYGIKMENIVIVANSVGAVTASTWVHDYAPRIRSMVLAAPAFRIRLYLPLAVPCLRLWNRVKKDAVISSYVKSKLLTHDPEQAAAYDADPLITKDISVKVLLGLHDAATRVIEDAGTIQVPTLVLSAGSDWVVKNKAQRRFFKKLGSGVKQMEAYPGFHHAVFYEQHRERPIADTRKFLLESFDISSPNPSRIHDDKGGPTRSEYDLLRQPAEPIRNLAYKLQRRGMHSVGKLSEGVRIGIETGFDSGRSLDYVYDNRARGTGPVGKWIDRNYLNAVGWRGIRTRREHIRELLTHAVHHQQTLHGRVEILDVATGCGRYVLDVLETLPAENVHALLRDWTPENLAQGEARAAVKGLTHIDFAQGDAFDPDSYGALTTKPNIVIVSGLYELFPENDGVRRSLAAIADCLEDGGFLIYTCQPWHPQVEMIARTLVNREGVPWIMRRRSQGEMDDLVKEAGLKKCEMRIDTDGIFTVSVAVKSS